MAEVDGARIKAKYKLKLLFMMLVFVVLVGAFLEYQRMKQPLDEVAFVYANGSEQIDVMIEQQQDVISKPMVALDNKEVKQESAVREANGAKNKDNQPVAEQSAQVEKTVDNNLNALPEFLGVLKNAREVVERSQFGEPILNKIIQTEPMAEPQNTEQKVFQDGKIEVYDSNKGVVAVVETAEAVENVKQTDQANTVNEVADKTTAKTEQKGTEVTEKVKQDITNVAEDVAQAVEGENNAEESGVAIAQDAHKEIKDLAKEEIEAVLEQEKNVAEKAEDSVRQRINQDLGEVKEAGEDAPIVLIPGLVGKVGEQDTHNESQQNKDF